MVLPKVYHQLALGNVLLGALKSANKAVRSAIRRWLNLPHDTPNAYLHAPIAEEGEVSSKQHIRACLGNYRFVKGDLWIMVPNSTPMMRLTNGGIL